MISERKERKRVKERARPSKHPVIAVAAITRELR